MQLNERVGWKKAMVALANKNARILWAVLARDGRFDPTFVSEAQAPHSALIQRPALLTIRSHPQTPSANSTTGQTGGR